MNVLLQDTSTLRVSFAAYGVVAGDDLQGHVHDS
jgi:hypothetical protein